MENAVVVFVVVVVPVELVNMISPKPSRGAQAYRNGLLGGVGALRLPALSKAIAELNRTDDQWHQPYGWRMVEHVEGTRLQSRVVKCLCNDSSYAPKSSTTIVCLPK